MRNEKAKGRGILLVTDGEIFYRFTGNGYYRCADALLSIQKPENSDTQAFAESKAGGNCGTTVENGGGTREKSRVRTGGAPVKQDNAQEPLGYLQIIREFRSRVSGASFKGGI